VVEKIDAKRGGGAKGLGNVGQDGRQVGPVPSVPPALLETPTRFLCETSLHPSRRTAKD
jgi:hypothetical protein